MMSDSSMDVVWNGKYLFSDNRSAQWCSHYGNQCAVVFFFLNLEQKSYPMIHLYHSWAYTPKIYILFQSCWLIHLSLLSVYNAQEMEKKSATNGWIIKQWYTYAMEYYSAIKKKYLGKWVVLYIIILSEVTQRQKDKLHVFLPLTDAVSNF